MAVTSGQPSSYADSATACATPARPEPQAVERTGDQQRADDDAIGRPRAMFTVGLNPTIEVHHP